MDETEVAQSCLTPSDPMDCSPPGPFIHGIFQARVLEWSAIAFSGKVTILIQMTKRDNTTFNIQKMKIMASGPITSWEIDGETGNSG